MQREGFWSGWKVYKTVLFRGVPAARMVDKVGLIVFASYFTKIQNFCFVFPLFLLLVCSSIFWYLVVFCKHTTKNVQCLTWSAATINLSSCICTVPWKTVQDKFFNLSLVLIDSWCDIECYFFLCISFKQTFSEMKTLKEFCNNLVFCVIIVVFCVC